VCGRQKPQFLGGGFWSYLHKSQSYGGVIGGKKKRCGDGNAVNTENLATWLGEGLPL